MRFNPLFTTDFYKTSHHAMYPPGTQFVQSNLTARGSRIEGVDQVVFFGLQLWVVDELINNWGQHFFKLPWEQIEGEYERRMGNSIGPGATGSAHFKALHELGYLPIVIKAVPEGTRVPLRVPMLTIENTHPDFYWLVNYLETSMSAALWLPVTSATNADRFRRMLDAHAVLSGDPEFTQFQGHDFSMRGMSGVDAAAVSGAAHLLSFVGTDTIPAIELLENYYRAGAVGEMVGVSVPATEHAVMCAGGDENEDATFRRLMELHPSGILSVVSDTWDLWHVLTKILPANSDQILARDGKLVIRPDSGDPADILCGDPTADPSDPAHYGVIELLWDAFGGTTNDKGYRVLDEHVGAIYGDAINYDRGNEILSRLEAKGFSSANVVFGVGSYTYQYVTRDTFGMAVKATWCQIDGVPHDIYKDPVTDDGTKKSARGRLAVLPGADGRLELIESPTLEQEEASVLTEVFRNGQLRRVQDLQNIRERLAS